MGSCFSSDGGGEGVIGVIGASGAQGGSLAKALLASKKKTFKVRAFTRDPAKESMKPLKDAGAEVVALDLDKKEGFEKAFEGLTGLFVVTNFWESMSPSKETQQVKDVVEAAEKAGVKHYVWSTLEDTTSFYDGLDEKDRVPKLTDGLYVPHFDAKGKANDIFPKSKTTFLFTSFYLENFYNFGMVSKGVLCNNVPSDATMPVISAADIGKCACGIFEAGSAYKGKSVYICGEKPTFASIMETISKVTGKEYKHTAVDRDTYAGFGFPGADDLANMFDYNVRCKDFAKVRDPVLSKKLNPELKSVKQWAEENKEAVLKVGPE